MQLLGIIVTIVCNIGVRNVEDGAVVVNEDGVGGFGSDVGVCGDDK